MASFPKLVLESSEYFLRSYEKSEKAAPMEKSLILITGTLLLTSCVSSDYSTDNRSIANNKYANAEIGLSLQFPASWELKLDQIYGSDTVDLVALAPPIQDFSAYVLVQIEANLGNTDLAAILDTVGMELQARIPDLGQYQSGLKDLNGKQYAEISYTTTSRGNLRKYKQDFFINRGKDIWITYVDFASRFDQNTDFVSISNSMTIE
jgi:hypothetical protein